MKDGYKFLIVVGVFVAAYFIPFGDERVRKAILEAFYMLQDYAQKHVLLCLVPAFFIAGAISALLNKETVLKYFGRGGNRALCYTVAATSGTILAVCSCTILPMFAGIEKKGAGIGPATAFLFSGPAINLLAIVLTWRVLGFDIGLARAISAVSMAVIIGLIMEFIFERNKKCDTDSAGTANVASNQTSEDSTVENRPKHIAVIFLGLLTGVLLSATAAFEFVAVKWTIVAVFVVASIYVLRKYFTEEEKSSFYSETWSLFKKIFPLLLIGTFLTGVIGYFMPMDLIKSIFGSNSFLACFTASVVGALLCMPTLLEVPIVGTLFGYSTGITAPGPALALLLAGPSLSLPSMIVIWRVIGARKASAYISLVVIISTIIGMLFGAIVG